MPSVREILGVPALPPARATTATTRLRAGLARLHAALAPPPLRVVETMLTMLDPALLVALCALDVPDRLTDRTTIDTLARDVGAPRDRVERLLRAAATRRW